MAIVQAATEGAQTLLPVYVFDREKFNTPTLAGKVKQKQELATTHVITLFPMYRLHRWKDSNPPGARKSSARRARFLLESLQCLRRSLEKAGSGLAVALGPPQEVIPKLCEGANVTVAKVQWNDETGIAMGQSGGFAEKRHGHVGLQQ